MGNIKNLEKNITDMSADNILKDAIDSGIIDVEAVKSELEMKERTRILNQHEYNIWQGKTNLHWYTYLPDPKKGRVQKERKTRKEIEDLIVDFYQPEKEEAKKIPKTLEELFPEWYKYKASTGAADSYVKKIYDMWKKYYKDTDIVKKQMRGFDKLDLEMWAHDLIKNFDMNKKQYYNATMVIRQALDYAVDKGYIIKNPFREFTMKSKYLRRDKKKEDSTQVFLTDEQPKVEEACWDKFENRPMFTSPLAILLHFRTGLRVGEMVALRKSDIEGDHIHVQRQQVGAFELQDVDGELKPVSKGAKIVEHPKTAAGDRYVYLTPEARKIIDLVIESNEMFGNKCEDYLFVCRGQVMKETTIICKLYDVCDEAGIPRKSTHKIRKTFVSALIDADVNINTVRKTVGHEKESTTLSSYTYDRHTDDTIKELMDRTLDK